MIITMDATIIQINKTQINNVLFLQTELCDMLFR